jgi:sugar-specific transcriptional regulator TrmB
MGNTWRRESMRAFDDEVQVLNCLGLTFVQAKVYLSLAKLGKSTISQISKASSVARGDVYRAVFALQELSLIERAIEFPTKYEAVPPQEGLSILLHRRHKEYSIMHEKAMSLQRQYGKSKAQTIIQEVQSKFVLIPKKESQITQTKKLVATAQRSVAMVTSRKQLLPMLNILNEQIEKALQRSVNVRFVTEKPEDEKSLPTIAHAFEKNPAFRIKYLPTAPQAHIALFDEKWVTISTSTTAGLAQAPILLSNTPCLLAVAQNYFETMWNTALELKPEEYSPNSQRNANNF